MRIQTIECRRNRKHEYEKPEQFLGKIRNLGPKKQKGNTTGTHRRTRKIINDEKVLLDKWRADFKNLYNGSDRDYFVTKDTLNK